MVKVLFLVYFLVISITDLYTNITDMGILPCKKLIKKSIFELDETI